MKAKDIIILACEQARMIKVAPKCYRVETRDASHQPWHNGPCVDWYKARPALAEARIRQAAMALGMSRMDAEQEVHAFVSNGGAWRDHVRRMVRSM